MFNIQKWVDKKKSIAMRTAGLEEKHQASERLRTVAMKILASPEVERRIKEVPVEVDRRIEAYDYHQKLA